MKISDLSINRLTLFGDNIQLEDKIHEITKTLGVESKVELIYTHFHMYTHSHVQ